VTLVDAGEPGGGTSASSFAWLNSHSKEPRAYHDLNVAGIAEHAALGRELGAAPWLHLTGGLQWATTPEGDAELRRGAERLRAWDYPVESIETARVVRDLEPGLALDPARVPAVWYAPGEGWIDAPGLIRSLVERARERGATVQAGSAVTGIALAGGRVGGVRLADGTRLPADAVIDCAGPRAAEVAALAGVRLPLERVPGLLAVSHPVAPRLNHVCHGPDVAFRPDPAGGVVMGHAESLDRTIDATTPTDPPPPACGELLARTARFLPAVTAAGLSAARIGVRPIPADGVSVAGPVPSLGGFYVAVTHSAVTLGPLLGRLLAEEVATGRPSAQLAPFRPDRFGAIV
jgi:glycine/D-amino acid oxidase-like deaminating enzyme